MATPRLRDHRGRFVRADEPAPTYRPTSDVFRDETICSVCGGLVVDRDTHTEYHRNERNRTHG